MKKLARAEAWALLTEYTKGEALQRHALAVEAVMAHFGRLNGEDEEIWAVAGLLHDLDYEQFPEEHCHKSEEIMRERGVDEFYIRAMNCHGWGICTNVEPQ
ncbi:MAG: HDIG domain-containing protein, partial [Firmicutes bacterium]|nr:HDIG domain-containing protein [Bacillota bacterium]